MAKTSYLIFYNRNWDSSVSSLYSLGEGVDDLGSNFGREEVFRFIIRVQNSSETHPASYLNRVTNRLDFFRTALILSFLHARK
jgi:hypothetical protein